MTDPARGKFYESKYDRLIRPIRLGNAPARPMGRVCLRTRYTTQGWALELRRVVGSTGGGWYAIYHTASEEDAIAKAVELILAARYELPHSLEPA